MEHVHRIPTGFAICAKDSDAKIRLLEALEKLNESGVKVDKPSEIVALRIAIVSVGNLDSACMKVYISRYDHQDQLS